MSPAAAPRAGGVRVASEVVATIAALAALDVEGVAAMCEPQGVAVGRFLRRPHGHRGVRVTMVDAATLRLDLHLAIVPRARLPQLVEAVQAAVAEAVHRMLGLAVATVDVHVADVQLPLTRVASRRRARELALRVLFAAEGGGGEPVAALAGAAEAMAADPSTRRLAERLVTGVLAEGPAIDRRLAAASDHWALDQMAQVERTILRMAAFEMGPSSPTPVRVAINEAVELAKVYAGGDAARFVNGVLGHLAADPAVTAAGAEGDAGPAGR